MNIEFAVAWFDMSTHQHLFASILRWCDTAQALLFPVGSTTASKELHSVWATGAVMRSNRLHMQMPPAVLIKSCDRVRVWPFLTSVGRTSWNCGFRITTVEDDPQEVALVETTMVNTNADHTESVPLPHIQFLKSKCVSSESEFTTLGRPEFSAMPAGPDGGASNNIFRFDMRIRKTDCDSLGHVNNSVYASLGEEARCHAAFHGGFSNDKMAHRMANEEGYTCCISYIGQARPFEVLKVSTWAEPSVSHKVYDNPPGRIFRVDFARGSEIITRMSITVLDGRGSKQGGSPVPEAPSAAAL